MAQNPDWPRDSKSADDLFPAKEETKIWKPKIEDEMGMEASEKQKKDIMWDKVPVVIPNKDLKYILRTWGNYKATEKTIYLYDNVFLKDEKMIEILKKNRVKIQLDLFT